MFSNYLQELRTFCHELPNKTSYFEFFIEDCAYYSTCKVNGWWLGTAPTPPIIPFLVLLGNLIIMSHPSFKESRLKQIKFCVNNEKRSKNNYMNFNRLQSINLHLIHYSVFGVLLARQGGTVGTHRPGPFSPRGARPVSKKEYLRLSSKNLFS